MRADECRMHFMRWFLFFTKEESGAIYFFGGHFLENACRHVDDVDALQMMWGNIFYVVFECMRSYKCMWKCCRC